MKNLAVPLMLFVFAFSLCAENQINDNPLMTRYLMQKRALDKEKFFLFDVGASGGIASYWKFFGKSLVGVGFDPLVSECERLNKINQFSGFIYEPSYIVSEITEIDQYTNKIINCPIYERSSSRYYLNNFKIDYTKQFYNRDADCLYTEKRISLDRYCLENKIKNVDFIKTDTDGADYAVLRGAEKLLQNGNILGLYVECNFHGEAHPNANSFRNIDRFLVENGFTLFDLSTVRYTKAQLPGKFLFNHPAQTFTGQISWGDALYLKDFVFMKNQGKEIPNSQIIKMACLQEIFGLPDCAAELLVTFRDQLANDIDVDRCLDALTEDMGLYRKYNEHVGRFRTNRQAFFSK